MKENELILGLDVSTKTIGISLFEDRGTEGKLKFLKHVTPVVKPKPQSKVEELVKKLEIFEEEFLKLYQNFNITRVIIEEPLLRSNNINTVGTLLKFNGMVCMSVYRILNVIPEFVSSYDARKYGFPELMEKRTVKKSGERYSDNEIEKKKPTLFGGYPMTVDKKSVIWEMVADREPQVIWDYGKKGTLKKEAFDMSDAYACVLGYMRQIGSWK